jgi:hypothetical protein
LEAIVVQLSRDGKTLRTSLPPSGGSMRPKDDVTHYLEAQKVPRVEASTSVTEFFDILNATDASGAIVGEGTEAVYIFGVDLGYALLRRSGKPADRATLKVNPATLKVSDYLPGVTKFAVEPEILSDKSDVSDIMLGSGAPHVIYCIGAPPSVEGFLFAHESMRYVNPPKWVCEDGHVNLKFGLWCAECPRAIVGVKS